MGIVYGLVAVLGFVQGHTDLRGFLSNNMPDVWLHVAIAFASLGLGFGVREGVTAGAAGTRLSAFKAGTR